MKKLASQQPKKLYLKSPLKLSKKLHKRLTRKLLTALKLFQKLLNPNWLKFQQNFRHRLKSTKMLKRQLCNQNEAERTKTSKKIIPSTRNTVNNWICLAAEKHQSLLRMLIMHTSLNTIGELDSLFRSDFQKILILVFIVP